MHFLTSCTLPRRACAKYTFTLEQAQCIASCAPDIGIDSSACGKTADTHVYLVKTLGLRL